MLTDDATGSGVSGALRISRLNQYVPLYPGEETSLDADVLVLKKAQKKEAKLRARCELAFTDPVKGPKARYNYLSSLACLRAKMWEANGRRLYRQRLSPRQIIEASMAYKVLLELGEPVGVHQIPKSSGDGWRTIYNFGPVARGAQRMVAALLQLAYKPAPFQFIRQGVHAAIQEALRLITEEEYTHVAEIDITGHYPSFGANALIEALPVPKQAALQIVLAASAKWEMNNPSLFKCNQYIHPAPSGIPPGSAASTAVAEWSVSQLNLASIHDAKLVVYADNFFLFGKNTAALKSALEALRSAIAALPGGVFYTHPSPDAADTVRTVASGFFMLGCEIVRTSEGVDVSPTETSLQALEGRFELDVQAVEAYLYHADKYKDHQARFEGVQAYLTVLSYVRSWTAAHSMCKDIQFFSEDMECRLAMIANAYGLTETELHEAKDSSTEANYYPSSKSSSGLETK